MNFVCVCIYYILLQTIRNPVLNSKNKYFIIHLYLFQTGLFKCNTSEFSFVCNLSQFENNDIFILKYYVIYTLYLLNKIFFYCNL
jgi:hypothetical protein